MGRAEIIEKYWEEFLQFQVDRNRHLDASYWTRPTVEHEFWLWYMQTKMVKFAKPKKEEPDNAK